MNKKLIPYPLVVQHTSSNTRSSASTHSSSGTVFPSLMCANICSAKSHVGKSANSLRTASPIDNRTQPYCATNLCATNNVINNN